MVPTRVLERNLRLTYDMFLASPEIVGPAFTAATLNQMYQYCFVPLKPRLLTTVNRLSILQNVQCALTDALYQALVGCLNERVTQSIQKC